MKKFLTLILALLLTVSGFAGCSLINEKEVSVDFSYNGEVVATKTVSIFTNQLVPSETKAGITVDIGYKFLGWSTDPEWTFDQAETNPLIRNVVHRKDVEKNIVNGRATLYAIIYKKSLIPKADLVVGWYAKTSTSGLNADRVDAARQAFYTYLSANSELIADYLSETGKTVETLDIVYRSYEGDVASMGSEINADGDVDVVLGVGNNINSTAGVKIVEKTNKRTDGEDIVMGGKVRYIALLPEDPDAETPTERFLGRIFYEWVQSVDAAACWA